MSPFDALDGNTELKISLKNALDGRFPQTVLLSGDDTAGLETLSQVLSAGILCENQKTRPCGECISCRKVQQGVHPDLFVIDEGENELKIDLARQIKTENSLIPNDGARRVTVIRHAQNLNIPAQNALLKELEEPPKFAFFILTAEKPDALLETVRSRCTKFSLEPPVHTVDTDDAVRLLSPYLEAIASKREDQMMKAALKIEKIPRRELLRVLEMLGAALRDAVFVSEGLPQQPLVPLLRKESKAVGRAVCSRRILELYEFIYTLSGRVSRNAASAAVTCALTSDAYRICFL